MGALRILEPGLLTTVQDLGRPGFAALGVPAGGAADTLSPRIGNRLVGAPDAVPALEMALRGDTIEFESDALIALTGGECEAAIESPREGIRPCPLWQSHAIRAGERLHIGPILRRARSYLCVSGGLRIAPALGSASTHLGAGFGVHAGRARRAGARHAFGVDHDHAAPRALSTRALSLIEAALDRRSLRAVNGSHADSFGADAQRLFWSAEWSVSARSDRMGLRLSGDALGAPHSGRMPSEGMPHGAVQIPEGGEPIVLLSDHPTTGGYPVLACVGAIDLPALGQLRPGDRIRFERTTVEEARSLGRAARAAIDEEVPPA